MHAPLHLALGDHAGNRLGHARRHHDLRGTVVAIPEDPSHGPLDNGVTRIAYMQACFRGLDEWRLAITDAFAPWRALLAAIAREPPGTVVVWHAGSVSQVVFLRMACWWLRDVPVPMAVITVPPCSGVHAVVLHEPATLAGFAHRRRRIGGRERGALAAAFTVIRDRPEILRRYDNGRLRFLPADHYDPLLLDACAPGWQAAARVVGDAMARCDGRNRMSDAFFCSRLQHLIDTGWIEVTGERRRVAEYQVRLAAGR
ncbi:MAG TPA: DUF3658 domain-containing protein [Acetobacteraceae bacterium]|nr:DUF3658 domain-containing protein [Acetobacteraceae bacterium]